MEDATEQPKTGEMFHPGELFLQRKNGVAEKVAQIAPRIILDHLTDQHEVFYSQLNMLFVRSHY